MDPDSANGSGERPLDRIVDELYGELRRIAGAAMAGQQPGHTLQPTAIVNEAWLRLARAGELELSDRKRFLALAAKVMRQILVDHARTKGRTKRGGAAVAIPLPDELAGPESTPALDLVALDEALRRLAAVDPRQVEIVEMRYLVGLEVEEVAQLLGVSATTVKREAAMARAWLLAALGAGGAGEARDERRR